MASDNSSSENSEVGDASPTASSTTAAASDYQPVACRFYDELGLRKMRGQTCTLVVEEEGGAGGTETVDTVIADVFTEGDAEYVRLQGGRRIRLDRIRRVDDVTRPGVE